MRIDTPLLGLYDRLSVEDKKLESLVSLIAYIPEQPFTGIGFILAEIQQNVRIELELLKNKMEESSE